jgi:hypothetical protein
MLLGSRQYALNDVRVIRVNYKDWLVPGYVLLSVTAAISPTTGITSTVGAVQLDPTEEIAFITLNCGTVVNESFTLNIQAKDTFGQTINDQLNVTVVTPGTT